MSSPRLPFWLTLFKAQNNQFVHFELDGYARVHPYGRSLRLLSPELLDMQGVTLDTVKGEGETFYRTPDGTLLCRRTVKSDMTYVLLIYRDDHGELRSALTICSPIIAPSDSAMCQLTPHVSIFQSPASICSPLYLDTFSREGLSEVVLRVPGGGAINQSAGILLRPGDLG